MPTRSARLIDAAEREPDIAALQSELHHGNMASFYSVVERGGVPVGKLAADVIASALGPLFYRRWFSKAVIDNRFVRNVADNAIAAAIGSKGS